VFLLKFSGRPRYALELNCTAVLDGDVGSTADVIPRHPHIPAVASWFRKLENASTLGSEWLMLLFNCSPCCPSNYLITIASTFRAKVRSITDSIPCCNWPNHFTKDPSLLPDSPFCPHTIPYSTVHSDSADLNTWPQYKNYISSLNCYQLPFVIENEFDLSHNLILSLFYVPFILLSEN
jgi:hypothetical protein